MTKLYTAARLSRPVFRPSRALALATCLFSATVAWAQPSVSYTAVNYGGTAWHYDYLVSGPLDSGEAVNLLFDFMKYDSVDVVIGSYNALALSPLVSPPFSPGAETQVTLTSLGVLTAAGSTQVSVSFTWLPLSGNPGSQPFEHLDTGFTVVGNGSTVAAVPEPASVALMLAGLALLAPAARRAAKRA